MKKLIFFICITFWGAFNVFSQSITQVVGFENERNAIITVDKGEILNDKFEVTVNVNWINKKGKSAKMNALGILLTKDNLSINPSRSVTCKNIEDGNIIIKGSKILQFEIHRNYTGEAITIFLKPVCIKNESLNNTSQAEFSLPEKLAITYPGYLDKVVYQPITDSPDLIIKNELFLDIDSNNVINALEKTILQFDIENIGNGIAKNVKINPSLLNEITGIKALKEINVGDISPSEVKEVTISIETTDELVTGIAEFKIEALEERGFDAFPLHVKIETLEFQEPDIRVVDAVFSTRDGGKIQRNFPINLRVLVQNVGKGRSENVSLSFNLPQSNYIHVYDTNYYDLGTLSSGQTRVIDFSLTAARRYTSDNVPVRIDLSEELHEYAHDTIVTLNLQDELVAVGEVMIRSTYIPSIDVVSLASLSSDVDRNIPITDIKHANKFALVIGNEDYTNFQRSIDHEINVDYAKNDARVFKEYLIKTLGYEEGNVYLLLDATKGEMEQKIDLISKRCSKKGPESEMILFYAGHGLPDDETKEAYLIPVDVSGSNLSSGIMLSAVYDKLGETGANRISVFLDACFTGGSRDGTLIAARGVKVKYKSNLLPGNIIVLSASSSTQSALPYRQKYHGMFTYYLLKGIQETQGETTYKDLFDNIIQNVSEESLKINEQEQDPEMNISPLVIQEWETWQMK